MCIFDFLIFVVGYWVARVVLPFLSLHRVYVQPLLSAPRKRFNVLGWRRDDNGRIELEETPAGFIGFLLCLLAFFTLGLLIRAAL